MNNIKLGGLFFPIENEYGEIPWDTLYIPYIYKEIWIDGIYIDVLNGLKDATILDIGANIGIITEHMRAHAKKIYAVEPASEHFAALKQNKEFNNWDNVEIFNYAITDKDGEAVLNKSRGNRTCNTLVQEYKSGEKQKVKGVAMDTFFKENNITSVDFCKMDIEGSEELVLRSEGFKKVAPKIKSIMLEFHFKNWPKLVEHMGTLGFKHRIYQSDAIVVLFHR